MVDATIVSPVGRNGEPRDGSHARAGVVLANAARRKRRQTYPELSTARRCRLVVFGIEVGGRLAPQAASFVRLLARARAASVPAILRPAAQAAWVLRWSGILAVAAQRALAASLLHLPLANECTGGGAEPALHELLADMRWHDGPERSRMPSRAA